MAAQQIEINIPIFERNLKLFNKKGLRRSYSSVIKHKQEYADVAPLSSSEYFVMEVTIDKEYVDEFQNLLKENGFNILGSTHTFHIDNLIKDYEANKQFFPNREDQMSEIIKDRDTRLANNKPFELLENDDVKFYFFPHNDNVKTLYDFVTKYKEVVLAYAKEKDITIMLRPHSFSNQFEGFFGFNFFDADSKEEVVVDYAARITVNVDFNLFPTVYAAAVILGGVGKTKEELASADLNVHLISENLKYQKA